MKLSTKIIIASACLFFSSLVLIFGFSSIFKCILQDQSSLRQGNLIRKFYLKIPFPLDFRVYFFNVSNPNEVHAGDIPIVSEIGPYCYDAFKEKINITENKTDDSLTYTPYETYFFNQNCSGKLSDNDNVTIINPLIMGMINTVATTSPGLLTTLYKAINVIFKSPTSMYMTVRVRDILFDGFSLNCSVKDFAAKAVCSQIRSQVPGIIEREKNILQISLFGTRNGTIPRRVKVSRGTKNSKDVGRLLELDGKSQLTSWLTDECNHYRGTDGWIFPTFLDVNEPIWSHSTDLCRNIYMTPTSEQTEIAGVSVYKYVATLGDQTSNEADKCYCPSNDTCLARGVFDMTKCLKVPIMATLPHFYETDPKYLDQVVGLKPNKTKHSLFAYMQPMMGAPIHAEKKMQFNFAISPIEKIPFLRNISTSLHPLLWIQEGVVLHGEPMSTIKAAFMVITVIDVLKYVLLTVGLTGSVAGVYMHYKNRNVIRQITPIEGGGKNGTSRIFAVQQKVLNMNSDRPGYVNNGLDLDKNN